MRNFIPRISLPIAAILSIAVSIIAQSVRPDSLKNVITASAEQRTAYINTFKDLMSEETKTFEIFDKHGDVKKHRTVVSTFIVYQLSHDDRGVAEYRNVKSVDGKTIDGSDKRAQDFFDDIIKLDSSKKELERLEREGSRFDLGVSLNGMTLYEGVALADNMQPYFEFKIDGVETIHGRETYVLSYRQTRESPYIITNSKNAPSNGKLKLIYDVDIDGDQNANGRLNGKLWIDTGSFQVVKEIRDLTIQPEGFLVPALYAENVFEYQDSPFGIRTPTKITYTEFFLNTKPDAPRKVLMVTFEYKNFTKPNVEVKSADIKSGF